MAILLLALKTKSFWFAYRYKFIQAKIYFIIAQYWNTGSLQAYEHIISIATEVYDETFCTTHTLTRTHWAHIPFDFFLFCFCFFK